MNTRQFDERARSSLSQQTYYFGRQPLALAIALRSILLSSPLRPPPKKKSGRTEAMKSAPFKFLGGAFLLLPPGTKSPRYAVAERRRVFQRTCSAACRRT